MSRTFREWSPEQSWLFPPSPQDWLPAHHLVYFLLDVSTEIDIAPIVSKDDSDKGGKPPYNPRMMLVRLLSSDCSGIFSSRKIAASCETDVAFRVIVQEDVPDFRTISEFRRRHLSEFQHLFVEVLKICQPSGLLKVGRLALDGTQVKANASRHKAMSDDRMTQEEQRLEAEIAALLEQAQQADEREDEQFGPGQRGDSPQRPGGCGPPAEGAAERHRSRIEDHEDLEQGVRPVWQRPGGGQRSADHRGGRRDESGERCASGRADGRAGRDESPRRGSGGNDQHIDGGRG
jgi:transposase